MSAKNVSRRVRRTKCVASAKVVVFPHRPDWGVQRSDEAELGSEEESTEDCLIQARSVVIRRHGLPAENEGAVDEPMSQPSLVKRRTEPKRGDFAGALVPIR